MNRIITLIVPIFCFFGLNASSQLDSAYIVSVDEIVVNATDTLGVVYQDTVLEVKIYVNDFDFFGELVGTITDQPSQYPLQMVKINKAEIEVNNLYNTTSGLISIRFSLYEITNPLDIRIVVRNYQGANLPFLDTTYSK